MDFSYVSENLTNPALLFFLLGILAVQVKSDLKIPENSSKFINIYLMFSIGFKGGQELAHSVFNAEIVSSLFIGLLLSSLVPFIAFYILRRRLSVENSGAIAAAYGSVSAVTFVTAISFLEMEGVEFSGHMIAVMALMEAPAILFGVLLIRLYGNGDSVGKERKFSDVLRHSITNGSVLLILGSLVIGYLASEKQAQGIAPFTTDIFKGFLALFLLDMGLVSGKHLNDLFKKGSFVFIFAAVMPFVHGMIALFVSSFITDSVGNRLLFAILGAGASYIAVPAAMKSAVPKANPSLYLPMALGITFPINIVIGIPVYFMIAKCI